MLQEDEEEEMEPTPRAPRQKEMFPANKNLRSQGNRDQGDDRCAADNLLALPSKPYPYHTSRQVSRIAGIADCWA